MSDWEEFGQSAFWFGVATVLFFVMKMAFKAMWNYAVVAAVSVAQPIDYWQAMCLMVFLGATFGNSYRRGGGE